LDHRFRCGKQQFDSACGQRKRLFPPAQHLLKGVLAVGRGRPELPPRRQTRKEWGQQERSSSLTRHLFALLSQSNAKTTASWFVWLPVSRQNIMKSASIKINSVNWLPLLAAGSLAIWTIACCAEESNPHITVASYYFPNYHPGDPRNDKNKGKGWSEWELVKAAKPRFAGEHQPNVPLWGFTDESDPQVMAKKIAAAADHGINAFIFDWYHYDDGPYLQGCLDGGFLNASNVNRIKFALMWANHDWLELHPSKRGTPQKMLYPGKVTPEHFDQICDHVIQKYFLHPSYWRIEGKPYFSFYELSKLLENFGSVAPTRAALDRFRAKAKAAGLPGLHLNAVVWGQPILPGEQTPVDSGKLVHDLGFDSVTSYVWIHHALMPKQQTDYNLVRDAYFSYWDRAEKMFNMPYFPNVSMGWNPSPRCDQGDEFGDFGYPFTNTIKDNTPERFKEALAMAKRRLLARSRGPHILNINCWNEWTEGSYLEPDTVHGMKYLEAVKEVFPLQN
jgi:hypothetical protein